MYFIIPNILFFESQIGGSFILFIFFKYLNNFFNMIIFLLLLKITIQTKKRMNITNF